jgi:glycoprotein 6-alpha-L-fucosyltransferase
LFYLFLDKNNVSVHIRRGDKIGKEANYHRVEEYMFHVRIYYKRLKLKGYSGQQRVFVATDDEQVFVELFTKYPNFKFIDNKCFPFDKSFNNKERYTPTNLLHTIIDIHLLSMTDFIVCTMSSNVRFFNFAKI